MLDTDQLLIWFIKATKLIYKTTITLLIRGYEISCTKQNLLIWFPELIIMTILVHIEELKILSVREHTSSGLLFFNFIKKISRD